MIKIIESVETSHQKIASQDRITLGQHLLDATSLKRGDYVILKAVKLDDQGKKGILIMPAMVVEK